MTRDERHDGTRHDEKQDEEKRHGEKRPAETATEEVLDEFERAGTDPAHRQRKDRRRGEGGDAVTPNQSAQEDARGE
ncbi:hypothetical protein [Streptomyces sp. KL116D]|uniref:hypothetical protein n=1 Tax=Streptomyces sp. KL116D TaxID=3045152 RepID=UPI0035566EDE